MAERIATSEVLEHMEAGDDVLLVCAYEDDEKCKKTGVDRQVTLTAFRDTLPDIPKSREIVFFCA
ncbi:MAG: hypothetical protein PVI86_03985 [Phycisphaerae bacterium]